MKCIVCLTDENLNTHMKVDIDNEIYEVHLCDEHAETTTMKEVNKKVKEIKDKLRNAVTLAIDLGITIPEININQTVGEMPDMDIIPASEPAAPPATPAVAAPASAATQNIAEKPIPNKIVREEVDVELSEKEKIPCDTEIEMQKVNLKGGEVSIPKKTKGASGSTEIKILNTRDDMIQKRFSQIKHAADNNENVGYLSDCRICGGSGTHPITKNTCPKCGGTGMT